MLVDLLVKKLKDYYVVLVLLGFGVLILEDVKLVFDLGVVGVILGFVVVKIIEVNFDD